VAATVLVALLYVLDPALLEVVELKSYDLRQVTLGTHAPPGNVVIVAIDEQSLSQLGRWPWSRATLARLVEGLERAGARVIALDVFFPEGENQALLEQIERLEKQGGHRAASSPYHAVRAALAADSALAHSLLASGKVVLGMSFLMSRDETRHESAEHANRVLASVEKDAIPAPPGASVSALPLPAPFGMLANVEELQRAARYTGHINIFPDRDGTLRAAPLLIAYRGRLFASADVQTARLFLGDVALRTEADDLGIVALHLGGQRIETDVHGRALVHYYGPERTIPQITAADLLAGRFAPEVIKDRVALVGATAKGIGDIRVTPHGAAFPGVEIRATIIENLLRGEFVRRPAWLPAAELAALIALGLLLARVLPRLTLRASAVVIAALASAYLAVALWLFATQLLWVTLVYPLLLMLLLFMSSNIVQYFIAEAQRRHIKSAFQYYVPSAVVDEIARDVEKLRLGGDKRELTVLFSDIRGFTSVSEALAPEELVRLLNVYLTEMTDAVFRHHGSLDKYIGDAIMAVYGAPVANAEHPRLACRTALDMMVRLKELRSRWQREGVPSFDIGIGINTGPMIVGNMGSANRFNYTAIGDAVNLGARIESLNKSYGTHILLSEFTYAQVRDEFAGQLREVDRVRVRGREQRVRVYELIPPGQYADLHWLSDFEQAYRRLEQGDADGAAAHFDRLHEAVHDPVSAYHARRCRTPRRRADDN
jgi:adenylate cyclase